MRWIVGLISSVIALVAADRSRRHADGNRPNIMSDGGVVIRPALYAAQPPQSAAHAVTACRAVPAREDQETTVAESASVSPWRLVFGAVCIVLGIVGAIYFAYALRAALTLALIALLLAVGLQAPVARLHRLGVPRPIGLLLLYVAVIVGLVLAFWLLFPPVIRDLRELGTQAPSYLSEIQRYAGRLGGNVNIPQFEDLERLIVTEVSGDWQGYLGRIASVLSFTVGIFGGVLNAFLVLVLSIFIVVEGPGFRDHLLSLLPPGQQTKWSVISSRIAVKIQGWMLGTVFLALVVGSVTTVSLLLLGMPYPFLFGFIAGIGEGIPMIGPIIAAVPAATIAAFYGWGMFASIVILYIAIQQLENYILVPRIMGSQVDLPGLVVIVAFLLGSELAGITGGILAMPVAAIFQVLWLDWAVPAIRANRDSTSSGVAVSAATTAEPARPMVRAR